ncbi:MAG: hypothetical protein ACKVQJ_11645 [Pyrinomonadaceae bacterium]
MADTSLNFGVTRKMLGDAGEHYALGQFTFAGRAGSKMPEGWTAYDLAIESGNGLVRVSVKTRSETESWKAGSWFVFDDRSICEWLVFIFKPKIGPVRSWVIPFDIACENANKPGALRKDPHNRDISWAKLNRAPLISYEDNWKLERKIADEAAQVVHEGEKV